MPGWDSAPQAHNRVSNINFDNWIFWGGSYKYPMENCQRTAKFFSHLGFKAKVLLVPLTDLSAWVGFCTSSPQQGAKYQLWYLDIYLGGGGAINTPWKIAKGRQSFFSLGIKVKGISRAFNWLKCLGGILHLKPTAGCQISTLIFGFFFRGPYKYLIINGQRTAKFFLTWGLG